MTRKEWIADGILTLTALIWGTGFVVMKNTLSSVPPAAIIAIRYMIAAALTAVLFRRHLKGVTRADVARGALVGVSIDGVTGVDVKIVFEPEWTKDMMSEEAKLELGFL